MEHLTKKDIENIRASGKILKETLRLVAKAVKPGVSGSHLNTMAEENIRKHGAKPSFLNYSSGGERPFPASLCVSINENVVHGIPSDSQIIQEGDIVGLDLGVRYKGLCTDSAVTVIAGRPKDVGHKKLLEATKDSLAAGIKQVKAGNTTGDIGEAVEKVVNNRGFVVIKSLVGHGIGRRPHQEPQVPNFGKAGTGVKLIESSAIAIEPMVVMGKNDLKTASDGWSIETIDKSMTAHFEHTILVTKNGNEVIT
ncbi:MAG: type I methionyl aminopeptidase [Candidatus Njordarchaeales archaeon]